MGPRWNPPPGTVMRDDEVDIEPDEFRRAAGEAIVLSVGPTVLDSEVLPLDEPPQRLAQTQGPQVAKPDERANQRGARACRPQRPGGRRFLLQPSQLTELSDLPAGGHRWRRSPR
jgi:hypothetical protein